MTTKLGLRRIVHSSRGFTSVTSDGARIFLSAGSVAASIIKPTGMSALLLALLGVTNALTAFSQTNPLYAWTNFVGEPGFEERSNWSISTRNAGSVDGIGSAARFYSPCGVAVDDSDNLFVADTRNHKIRKVTPDGLVTMLAGGPGARGTNDDGAAQRLRSVPMAHASTPPGFLALTMAGAAPPGFTGLGALQLTMRAMCSWRIR